MQLSCLSYPWAGSSHFKDQINYVSMLLIIFWKTYMNNTVKYKQTYIFLNKKIIFNIKLNITLKKYKYKYNYLVF